jgi:hypothetical protein
MSTINFDNLKYRRSLVALLEDLGRGLGRNSPCKPSAGVFISWRHLTAFQINTYMLLLGRLKSHLDAGHRNKGGSILQANIVIKDQERIRRTRP